MPTGLLANLMAPVAVAAIPAYLAVSTALAAKEILWL